MKIRNGSINYLIFETTNAFGCRRIFEEKDEKKKFQGFSEEPREREDNKRKMREQRVGL